MLRRCVRRRLYWKRNAILIFLFLVGLTVVFYQYVQVVHQDERMKDADISKRAREAVKFAQVTEVEKGGWDHTVYVVRGTDEQEKEHLVWVRVLPNNQFQLTPMSAAESVSKKEMKAKIKAQYPDADVIRLTPAYMEDKEGKYMWQALVKRANRQGLNRYYYQLYVFTDGSPTGDEYELPTQ